jgi:hypothetical protein
VVDTTMDGRDGQLFCERVMSEEFDAICGAPYGERSETMPGFDCCLTLFMTYEERGRRAITTAPKLNTVAPNMKTARETDSGAPDATSRIQLHQEPGAPARPRHRRPVLRRRGPPGQAPPLRLFRALLRGRHPARGLGLAQELQAQRRLRAPHSYSSITEPQSAAVLLEAIMVTRLQV